MKTFKRIEHIYTSTDFEAIINDAIRFFKSTPVYSLPPERFNGTGVYAIYSLAQSGLYARYHQINRTEFQLPLYVGKAVPKGWRQGGTFQENNTTSYELYSRFREHYRSIQQGAGLNLEDFHCRFMILEGPESDLIGTVEATLIRQYRPLWNTVIDGFGNHDPGKGRYNQAKSDWDVCHLGRAWADKCTGTHSNQQELHKKIVAYFKGISHDT